MSTDTERAAAPRIRRSNADYRWTHARIRAFFEALGQSGKVAEAARSVGMSRQSAYRLRARYPGMDEAWALLVKAGKARRRAARKAGRKVTVRGAQGDSPGSTR